MNYWLVWPVGIVIWLALGWGAFAYFEAHALHHDARKDQITLSMFCYTIGSRFPLSIFFLGLLVGLFWGTLSTHLFWHWLPAGAVNSG
jgi:hypothetical protein